MRQEKSELGDFRACYQKPGLQLANISSTHIQCPEKSEGPKPTVRKAGRCGEKMMLPLASTAKLPSGLNKVFSKA